MEQGQDTIQDELLGEQPEPLLRVESLNKTGSTRRCTLLPITESWTLN